jgi:ribonuclease HI
MTAGRQPEDPGASPVLPSTRTRAVAWIDGGARGNPGEAGCGLVVELGDGTREEHSIYLGHRTNNVAEYAGLLAALSRAHELGVSDLRILSDSQLLVEQMNGGYRVKARHLQPLWLRAQELVRSFRTCRCEHVFRTANREADALANRAMTTRSSTLPVPEPLP